MSNLNKSCQLIRVMVNKRKYNTANTRCKVKGATTNDGNGITNKLNTLYVNAGLVLANSILHREKNPVGRIQQDILNTRYSYPVTENEICKNITSLEDNAAWWDDLKSSMIKHVKEGIAVPLVHTDLYCKQLLQTKL